jgi:site-specific DNA-adenine methylase
VVYPGGKNGAGVYQKLINLIPPHDTYIEIHLGGGAIMRYKRAANRSIGVDIDSDVVKAWSIRKRKDLIVISGDAVRYLNSYSFSGGEFVYCAPPI